MCMRASSVGKHKRSSCTLLPYSRMACDCVLYESRRTENIVPTTSRTYVCAAHGGASYFDVTVVPIRVHFDGC